MKFCGFCRMGTVRLQFPFAAPFLWNDPFWDEIGFAEKQFLQAPIFFRTCLDCFQSTQNPCVVWLWKAEESRPRKPHTGRRRRLRKTAHASGNHCASGPLPPKNFAFLFSLWVGCKGLGFGLGCGCEKTIFQALKNCCFAFSIWNDSEWTLLIAGVKPSTAEEQFFATWKIVFFCTALVRLRNEMLQLFFLCPGTNLSDKPGFAKKKSGSERLFFWHAPC